MRILYFYQYFSTSEGAWGTRVYEFAKIWVEKGHDVTVVTSIYSKSDLKSDKVIREQWIDGIRVKVINVVIDNKQSVPRRILSFIFYAIISSWFALTIKADIVISSSGPITVGIPGLMARWLRGRKLIFEARDLWPEGAVKMNIITNKFLVRLAYWFEEICYRSSGGIVALSPGIKQNIDARFPRSKTVSVTNAANINLFSSEGADNGYLSLGSYAIYFGNIGEVNHSIFLLDAAKILIDKQRSDIEILLIGDGQMKAVLQEKANNEKITNVVFLELMPKTRLVSYVQRAIASVIPLKPLAVFDTSSPNKLFESMAAGVPVIQTTQGWIRDFIHEYNVGITVDGNHPWQLAEQLIFLKDNPKIAAEMGSAAQRIARKYFDKDYLADKMLSFLLSIHGGQA